MDRTPTTEFTQTVLSITDDPTPHSTTPTGPGVPTITGVEWPVSDSVKLFVGQVPKHFEEKDLRPYMEPYGTIVELTILRNKEDRTHKGCAFVTYLDRSAAESAQANLHNKVILPTMPRPLQVVVAGTKQEELRKVFVGMLSKSADEEQVRQMFQRFGQIEELTVLKDKDGFSRGCAFIKFASRQQAQAAINEMHGSEVMLGANHPLVVKYADTEKERHARRMQKAMQHFAELSLGPPIFLPHPQFFNPLLYAQFMQQQAPLLTAGATPSLAGQLYTPAAASTQLLSPTSPTHLTSASIETQVPPPTNTLGSPNLSHPGMNPLTSAALSPNGLTATSEPLPSPLSPIHGVFPPYGFSTFGSHSTFGIPSPTPTPPQHHHPGAPPTPSQKEGPEGCNLFIYHLPQDFGDQELYNLFSSFGTIISAKVYVDTATNRSKCFGFVSYNEAHHAANAIAFLNGYQIGYKRLKVEYKKPRERKNLFN